MAQDKSEQYRGKWISKYESEENGFMMLDVVEVFGNEVKAIGRNLTLTELLNSYKPMSESSIRGADPFAMPFQGIPDDQLNDSKVDEPVIDFVAARNQIETNQQAYAAINNHQSFDRIRIPIKSPLTKEEQSILDMIDLVESKKPKPTRLTIELSIDLGFDIESFIGAAEMMGVDDSDLRKGLSVYLMSKLSDKDIKEKLIQSFNEETYKSRTITAEQKIVEAKIEEPRSAIINLPVNTGKAMLSEADFEAMVSMEENDEANKIITTEDLHSNQDVWVQKDVRTSLSEELHKSFTEEEQVQSFKFSDDQLNESSSANNDVDID